MASLEGSMAIMSKALESQNLIAELVTEAATVMDQNGVANGGGPNTDAQATVASAITGLGRVIDMII